MVKIDWRLALLSLITVPVGLFFFALMMRGSKESYENTVVKTKGLNDTAVEYINGIEVIKAFGKAKTSYEKFVIACFVLAFDWRIGLVLVAGIALYVVFNTVMQHATKPVAPRKHKADEGLVTQVMFDLAGVLFDIFLRYAKLYQVLCQCPVTVVNLSCDRISFIRQGNQIIRTHVDKPVFPELPHGHTDRSFGHLQAGCNINGSYMTFSFHHHQDLLQIVLRGFMNCHG